MDEATFKIEVLDKEFAPVDGWRASVEEFTLKFNETKTVVMQFKVNKERKIHVCSTLVGVDYDKKVPAISSTVCSRLWLRPGK